MMKIYLKDGGKQSILLRVSLRFDSDTDFNAKQRDELGVLADAYGLLYSAASDFHGQNEHDSLENQFPYELWERLRTKCGKLK